MIRAILASANRHKLDELREALPDWEIEPLAADDWPEETGETYYENALLKARFGRTLAEPERWVLGEDSGIEAVALDGAPGLHSARWAPGLDQADALLDRLAGEPQRGARMVTELVAIAPDGRELRGSGVLDGRDRDGAPGRRRLRLRPDLHPGRRHPDRRRDRRCLETPQLTPRPCRPGPRGRDPRLAELTRERRWKFTSAPSTITFDIT